MIKLLDPSTKDVLEGMNQALTTDLLLVAVVTLLPSVILLDAKIENDDKTPMEQNRVDTLKQLTKTAHLLQTHRNRCLSNK